MKRTSSLSMIVIALAVSGCMQRLLLVRSQPSGAVVYVNGEEAGLTPLEYRFNFYGTVDLELRKYDVDYGYRAVHLEKELKIPWYQYFPVDFITEFLVPWPIRDVHTVDVELERFPEERQDMRSLVEELDERVVATKRAFTPQKPPE